MAFLSILRDVILLLHTCRSVKFWSATTVFPQPVRPLPPSLLYDLIRTVNRPQTAGKADLLPLESPRDRPSCHSSSINENRNTKIHALVRPAYISLLRSRPVPFQCTICPTP